MRLNDLFAIILLPFVALFVIGTIVYLLSMPLPVILFVAVMLVVVFYALKAFLYLTSRKQSLK